MYRVPKWRLTVVREGSIPWGTYPKFGNSSEIFEHFKEFMREKDCEYFYALSLDMKNRIIGMHEIAKGSLNQSVVHPREVFKTLLVMNAGMVIFMHNHPSGDPTPSREDKECTNRLVKAGELLGVRVLDHIVFGEEYFSFADAGMLGMA
jgi:DNA repair protein RadC